jgi:hypothetical protein
MESVNVIVPDTCTKICKVPTGTATEKPKGIDHVINVSV